MTAIDVPPPVSPQACSPGPPPPVGPTMGLTVYGCDQDEAAGFRKIAPRFGVAPTIVTEAVSEANVGLASRTRCVSVNHKTRLSDSTLLSLRRAGVAYISTRSAGSDHIDVECAESLGLRIGNVTYSPDGVADYTVMLILMALRDAKAVLRRTDARDYSLSDARGKELRDLTVGVIGTGRIGAAVMDRLQGFGCRILAFDNRRSSPAHNVTLEQLLRLSDIVTLHTPLTADTHHLLDRRRMQMLKQGAFVINTGRGALLETEALLSLLESGRLAGAALDVLEGEEGIFYFDCRNQPVANMALLRLQQLPNVIISPHTAYYTDRALSDVIESTLINCLTFERESAAWTD